MACSGGFCSGQCYVDTCSAYVSPLSPYDYGTLWPGAAGNTTNKIHDENIEQLRISIDQERTRRGVVPNNYPYTPNPILGSDEGADPDSGNEATDGIIYGQTLSDSNEAVREIKTAINDISSGYVTYNVVDGNVLPYSTILEARTKIDTLRATCLCVGDCGGYSTCSCYGFCGCNYSDERLKEDIRSL